MPKTTPTEETASVGSQQANFHLEKHAHSSLTRTRKAKGRDLVYFLQQAHRTEIRKVTERVVLTEVQKEAYRNWLVKVRQGKRTDYFVQTQQRKLPKETFMLLLACSRMCKIRSSRLMQIRRQVCIQTHCKTCCGKEQFSIDRESHSIEWWTTDAITEKLVGWQETQ